MKLRTLVTAPLVKAFSIALNALDPDGWYARNGFRHLAGLLNSGGGMSEAGLTVSVESALDNSVVWAATRAISETHASFPLSLMQKVGRDRHERVEHSLYPLLHDEPNSEISDFEMRESMTAHVLLLGNAYARIARRSGSGEVLALYPMNPALVTPKRRDGGELYYEVADNKGKPQDAGQSEILHIRGLNFDGLQGYGIVSKGRNAIGLSSIQEQFASNWFARGGRRPYLLEHPGKFKSDEDFNTFRERWAAQYGNTDKFHEVPVLEGGMKWVELGFTPEQVQLIESRQHSVAELCRWFRLSPHLVQDLTHGTFSNIEHLAIQFIVYTMMPWCTRWEKTLRRQLLTAKEKADGLYFKHNMNVIARGDLASRMSAFSIALQNGVYSPNEVRALEDADPYEGGDDLHIQLNMQTVNTDGSPTASQAASLLKVGTTGGKNGTQN